MVKRPRKPENQQMSIKLDGSPSIKTKIAEDPDVSPSVATWSQKSERQEFFLPVSNFVWFYPEEVKIINHPSFQRLGRINQLGQTHLVFRGATHKRIEHSLGTVGILQRMIEAIKHNSEKERRHPRVAQPLNGHEERFTRLGALLHDMGHLAAGHTLEDELGLVGKHDADERITTILCSENMENNDGDTLEELIDKEYDKYVPKELKRQGIAPSKILRLLIRKPPKDEDKDKFRKEQEILERSDELRLNVCSRMIGDTICADLLDYLHRDWFHIGKLKPFDERILQYMEIRNKEAPAAISQGSPSDTFVISLGQRPKIRTDGVSAILEILEWRYQLAETALFHRTKLAAAAMLDRALFELWGEDKSRNVEQVVLNLSDEQLIDRCIEIVEQELKKIKNSESPDSMRKTSRFESARNILDAIRNRNLYTDLITYSHGQLDPEVCKKVKSLYGVDKDLEDKSANPQRRTSALRLLESDFGLPRGSVLMYCAEMKPKLAEVEVAVGEDIQPFFEYEKQHSDMLSGGHLQAQIRRFESLWRVHFFIERRTKKSLDDKNLLIVLNRAVRALILGDVREEERMYVAWDIATTLANLQGSPFFGRNVRAPGLDLAAKLDETVSNVYPTGLPTVGSYFEGSV